MDFPEQMKDEVNIGTPYDGVVATPSINRYSPLESASWDKRIDPLWETNFHTMKNTSWDKSFIKTRGLYDDGTGVLRYVNKKISSPIDLGDGVLYSQTAVSVMAVIIEFQIATTEHIMIMTGDANRSRVRKALDSLFAGGIIKKSNMSSILNREILDIWTINKKSDEFFVWLQGLEPWQYQLISGGRDIVTEWATNQLHGARHNIVTMDLITKALEVSPHLIGAWGERHTFADIFADQKLMPREFSRANVGDGALVTKSGTVIVLESSGLSMTGRSNWSLEAQNKSSSASKLAQKAGAWVAICARSDIDLRIIFIDIASKPSFYRLATHVVAGVKYESEKYISDRIKRREGMNKVYVADGRSWLPLPRMVSQDMETLTCVNCGDASSGGLKTRPLLTDEHLELDVSVPFVSNSMLSLHNPDWLVKSKVLT